jgi:hypothetical protein
MLLHDSRVTKILTGKTRIGLEPISLVLPPTEGKASSPVKDKEGRAIRGQREAQVYDHELVGLQ